MFPHLSQRVEGRDPELQAELWNRRLAFLLVGLILATPSKTTVPLSENPHGNREMLGRCPARSLGHSTSGQFPAVHFGCFGLFDGYLGVPFNPLKV